jgi:Fe-S cluster biogenesis protein NfuA
MRGEEMNSASNDNELAARLTRVLAKEIGPALQMDGSAIEVVNVIHGVAQVRLTNVCATCPSGVMTLVMGIEQELRSRIPEIEYLEAVP